MFSLVTEAVYPFQNVFVVGDPEDLLPRDVGCACTRCSRESARGAFLLCAAAAACLGVSTTSVLPYSSVSPCAVSLCPRLAGESSRGDLFGT